MTTKFSCTCSAQLLLSRASLVEVLTASAEKLSSLCPSIPQQVIKVRDQILFESSRVQLISSCGNDSLALVTNISGLL